MSKLKQKGGPGALLKRTLRLLESTPYSRQEIAAATGCSEWWISQLRANKIRNPSVNSIERLYEFLSGTKLGV